MKSIAAHEWLGVPATPPEEICLRAGELTAIFSDGRLLDIAFAGRLLLSEVYFALRDPNWGTVPYTITSQEIFQSEDGFEVRFEAEHPQGSFPYRWQGHITGTMEGALRYEAKGPALSGFRTNRLGFCVLHPHTCAGLPCTIAHTDGTTRQSQFPLKIAPHQPFTDIAGMAHQVDGMRCGVAFEGDAFECEDQRNWTDASFKTYCTPLRLPFPVQVPAGKAFFQAVAIECKKLGTPLPASSEQACLLDYAALTSPPGPLSLGSCMTAPLDEVALPIAKELGLHHVRLEMRFGEEPQRADGLVRQAGQIAPEIHLAAFLTEKWEEELAQLAEILHEHADIRVLLLHQQGRKVMDPRVLGQCRDKLARPGLKIGSGTDAYFTQLNREPLPRDLLDFVCYSNNPQVHAFDNHSIMQTTEGQAANVYTASHLYPGLPVHVTPLTLRIRWNPDATGEAESREEQLLKQVDHRQMSLFCGAWTLRSLVTLALSGAASATYFEVAGPRGLFADHQPLPQGFLGVPGMRYPAWFVMRHALSILLHAQPRMQNGHGVTALTDGERVLLANTTSRQQEIHLRNWSAFEGQMLEPATMTQLAMTALSGNAKTLIGKTEKLSLNPYGIFLGKANQHRIKGGSS